MKARKGTLFIPFSQFPPKKLRKDCFYHFTPTMEALPSLENIDSYEVLEGRKKHKCGYTMSNIDIVWQATL
ncbi:hypothetical protein QYF36_026964 [Acer negundo]|nr:hypothetical protein QYF36_026964 [Acer negundo]